MLKELENTEGPNLLNLRRRAGRSVRVVLVVESKGEASMGKLNDRDA